jgi:DNA-binding IclR family transcriptional regulator
VKIAGAQSAYRLLDILVHLGYRPSGLSLSEVADAVDLVPSTARRLLLVLCDTGFVTQDPVSRAYLLGPASRRLQIAATDRATLLELARPTLEHLRDSTAETVFFSVLDGHEITYLDCLAGTHQVQMYGRPGMRAPVHATAQGRVLAAHLDDAALDRLLAGLALKPFTDNTIVSVERLRTDLRQVKARGYALNVEELEPGVASIAGAVLDPAGHPVAAVCIGGPRFRINRSELVERFAGPVRHAAGRIGEVLFGAAGDASRTEPERGAA